jgi:hypothetical protein
MPRNAAASSDERSDPGGFGAAAGAGSVKNVNVGLTMMTRVSGPTVTDGLVVISGSIASIERERSDYRRRGRCDKFITPLGQDGFFTN